MFTIIVGSLNKSKGIKFNVKNIIVHEEYNAQNKRINDIALVEVTSGIEPQLLNNNTYYVING